MNNNPLNTRSYIRLIKSCLRQNTFSTKNITMYTDLIKNNNLLDIRYPITDKKIFNIKIEQEYILFDLEYSSIK